MKQNLTFRDARLTDLPRIVQIYNTTISSRMVTADTEPVTVESRMHWFAEHSPSRRPLWVFERADSSKDQEDLYSGFESKSASELSAATADPILGWLSFQSFYGRPAYNATVEMSIYLDPLYRGKGLGKYMLQKGISAAPQLGIQTILGFIFAHNEPSLNLFYGMGFAKWAHLPRVAQLDEMERDLIIVGLSLDLDRNSGLN